MTDALFGGALIASFFAGMVALFAPCCISVMLPAYFASSFGRGRALVAMTFLFAAGVSAVILPIALGAAAIGAAISANHQIVYFAGGSMMLAFGAFTLAGGRLRMPVPSFRGRPSRGPLQVVGLGAFSGIASACCAPVLAGVAALAGLSASFGPAIALGIAYVFGMVLPLFVIALLWDRFDLGERKLLRGRTLRLHAFGLERRIHSAALVTGLLLLALGGGAVAIGASGAAMPSSGWQVSLSAQIQHYASVVTDWAQTLPGWLTGLALLAALGALAWKALGQAGRGAGRAEPDDLEPQEEPVERREHAEVAQGAAKAGAVQAPVEGQG